MTGQIGSRDHRDWVLPEAERQPISSTPWSRAPSALLDNFDFILSSLFLLVPLYLFNPPPNLLFFTIFNGFPPLITYPFITSPLFFSTLKMSAPAAFSDIAKAANDVWFSHPNFA